VLLIGTGLTAVDVMLSLSARSRTAPILALSRRGHLPAAHLREAVAPEDPSGWLTELLQLPARLRTRSLVRAVREAVRSARARGGDWRAVIDGLRPHTASLWAALSEAEAKRFLRHVRPYWEVHRHRMAPGVADHVAAALQGGALQLMAGRVLEAHGDLEGVSLRVRERTRAPRAGASPGSQASSTLSLRVNWVINCTGPSDVRTGSDVAVQSLLEAGELQTDGLELGVLTGPRGEALDQRGVLHTDLVVLGTLRKPALWESTAVPELRSQAALAAEAVWEEVTRRRLR
jgi:uncharacterized NAD(P)/FAD-binding protein YdhS